MKKSVRLMLFLVLFLACIFVIVFIFPEIKQNIKNILMGSGAKNKVVNNAVVSNKSEEVGQQSAFNFIDKIKYDEAIKNEWFRDYERFRKEKYMNPDWKGDDWNYVTDYFRAAIVSIYPENNELELSIDFPFDQIFSKVKSGANQKVKVECNNQNSIVYLPQSEGMLPVSDNIFVMLQENKYVLQAKCLDSSCTSVGYGCIFFK